ncbi:MAG: hypothetical protein FWE03_07265 [Firmicutes bacterium]|nr:hypothetical protein [Bacillota bacterium]
MRKKLFSIVLILCMMALVFFAIASCEDVKDTFTVEFTVGIPGLEVPEDRIVEAGQAFILPNINREDYNLYWRIFGIGAGVRRAAGAQMPFNAHNTIAGGILRMEAIFILIPLSDQEAMQRFVIQINGLIDDLGAMNERELNNSINVINNRLSNWAGIALVGINHAELSLQTNRNRDLFVARINALIVNLANDDSLDTEAVGIRLDEINVYTLGWGTEIPLTGLNVNELMNQRNRHMNMFVSDINALIYELKDITDHLDDLIKNIEHIQASKINWVGAPLLGINATELSEQIQRRNDWSDLIDMQNFVIEINDLIMALSNMEYLFNLRRALNYIDGRIDSWQGIMPIGLNLDEIIAAEQTAKELENTDQGPMTKTALDILYQITQTGIHSGLTNMQNMRIWATDYMAEIIISDFHIPQLVLWGINISRTQIRVHASLSKAQAFLSATPNTYIYGNTTITSVHGFSRWYFATLVEHGAPGRMTDEQNIFKQQFLDQRDGISSEINRHLNRDTINTGFIYGITEPLISNNMPEPFRLVMQIGSACPGRRIDGIGGTWQSETRLTVVGFVVILANEGWASAFVNAPPQFFMKGMMGSQVRMGMHSETARRSIGNIAFFGEPVGLEEILTAYLNGDPINPRPFLSQEQRARSDSIRRGLHARIDYQLSHDWVAPDIEISMMTRIVVVDELTAPVVDVIAIFALSCLTAAQNFYNAERYWAEFTPQMQTFLSNNGYEVFIDGTFIFFSSLDIYDDLRYVVDNYVTF